MERGERVDVASSIAAQRNRPMPIWEQKPIFGRLRFESRSVSAARGDALVSAVTRGLIYGYFMVRRHYRPNDGDPALTRLLLHALTNTPTK